MNSIWKSNEIRQQCCTTGNAFNRNILICIFVVHVHHDSTFYENIFIFSQAKSIGFHVSNHKTLWKPYVWEFFKFLFQIFSFYYFEWYGNCCCYNINHVEIKMLKVTWAFCHWNWIFKLNISNDFTKLEEKNSISRDYSRVYVKP